MYLITSYHSSNRRKSVYILVKDFDCWISFYLLNLKVLGCAIKKTTCCKVV